MTKDALGFLFCLFVAMIHSLTKSNLGERVNFAHSGRRIESNTMGKTGTQRENMAPGGGSQLTVLHLNRGVPGEAGEYREKRK